MKYEVFGVKTLGEWEHTYVEGGLMKGGMSYVPDLKRAVNYEGDEQKIVEANLKSVGYKFKGITPKKEKKTN